MKKHVFGLISLSVIALAPVVRIGAQTPAAPTVDQILDKYLAASGGRAVFEKLTSVTAKGTIDVPDVGISGTITLLQKAPGMAATQVEIPGAGSQRDGCDGVIAWDQSSEAGVREKSGLELDEAKRAAIFPRELKLKSMYQKFAIRGTDKVGTRDAHVVDATPSEGSAVRYYFDTESGLLIRQSFTRQSPQGPLDVEVTFSDFKDVDGIKRPMTITQKTSQFTAIIKLTDVKHNTPIDDAVFKKPGF